MCHQKDGRPAQLQQGAACAFYQTVVFLLLTQTCAGQYVVVTPSQPTVAMAGEDTMLPCQLEPAADATDLNVEWRRPDLNPRFVYVWRDGLELESQKHPSFIGRSSVSRSKLKHGDISLNLQRVQLSDEGRYGCFFPTLDREATVELVVGAVSSLSISFRNSETAGMVLQCESRGWYPEPEVFWLDSAGELLSAGTTETLRGPDGLFNINSRLTVEKRHGSSFTCRVHQNNITQTKEIHIRVPDDFLDAQCSYAKPVVLILFAVFTCFAVLFIVCYCKRKQKSELEQERTNTEIYEKTSPLLNEEKTEPRQDVEKGTQSNELGEKKVELETKLEKLQNENRDVREKFKLFMNYEKELEALRFNEEKELHDVERLIRENRRPFLSLPEKPQKNDTNRRNLEMKHETAKKELQDTNAVLEWIKSEINNLKEKADCLKSQLEETKKQLVEIEEQKNENEMHTNSNQTSSKQCPLIEKRTIQD